MLWRHWGGGLLSFVEKWVKSKGWASSFHFCSRHSGGSGTSIVTSLLQRFKSPGRSSMAMASSTFLLLLLLKLCNFKLTDVHINCLFLMTSIALKDVSKDLIYHLLRSRFSKVCSFLAKLVLTTFSSRLRPKLVTDNCKQPRGLKKMEICAILPDLPI